MAETFLEQHALALNGQFVTRCLRAAVKLAVAVASEDPSELLLPPGYKPEGAADDAARKQELHERRVAFANAVLLSPQSYDRVIASAAASNSVLTAQSSDNDIEFTVSSIWNALAVS